MNNEAPASESSTQQPSVRKTRARRTKPVESGTVLLQANSRLTTDEAQVLEQARVILLRLAGASGVSLNAPSATREYLKTMLAPQERELFIVLTLDNRHRLIASDILFAGTIDGASVHPREVVKCALRHNAAAVIFCHYVAGHVMGIMWTRPNCGRQHFPVRFLRPRDAPEHITRTASLPAGGPAGTSG